jgi:hypothetical protein
LAGEVVAGLAVEHLVGLALVANRKGRSNTPIDGRMPTSGAVEVMTMSSEPVRTLCVAAMSLPSAPS